MALIKTILYFLWAAQSERRSLLNDFSHYALLLYFLFPKNQEEKRETNVLPWKSWCFQREKTDLHSLKQWLHLLTRQLGGAHWTLTIDYMPVYGHTQHSPSVKQCWSLRLSQHITFFQVLLDFLLWMFYSEYFLTLSFSSHPFSKMGSVPPCPFPYSFLLPIPHLLGHQSIKLSITWYHSCKTSMIFM